MGVDVLVLLPPSADPRRGGLSICRFTLALTVLYSFYRRMAAGALLVALQKSSEQLQPELVLVSYRA